MKKALQYLKNCKTKLDTKLYEKDIDIAIKCEEYYILAFKYIKKSFDRFRCDFDKYRNVQKKIAITLVHIVEIIEQVINCLHLIFYFAINSFQKMKKLCLLVIKLSNKLIQIRPI